MSCSADTSGTGVHYSGLWSGLPGWVRKPLSAGIHALPRNEALKRATYSLVVEDRIKRQKNLSIAPATQLTVSFTTGCYRPMLAIGFGLLV